jgi:MFS superfamily sulfate permease-like transporter
MRQSDSLVSQLKYDLPASLVVFLVALPLCLGIALASKAPLFSGIIAGVAGGLVVAAISKSPLSVSGPAAGLTVIVANGIETMGSFQAFLAAVVLAGVLQMLLGAVRAGVIGYYFPSAVIKGMLAAIGLILILKQIPHALGYDQDAEGDEAFVQMDGENTFSELVNAVFNPSPGAVVIAVAALLILILWERPFMKRQSFTRLVPGALIAVLAGTGINLLFGLLMPAWQLSGSHLVSLPLAGETLGQLTLPDWSAFARKDLYIVAATLAIVASLETLLSVEAADKLDPYKRNTPTNRELLAQGAGNLLSGLAGGLPLTAVIVRSSANVYAGARTRLSALLHGVWLLLSVLLIPAVLNLIPLAALAAILLMTGYKLAKISLFNSMYKAGWSQFLPFVITVGAILFTDLLIGILIGMGVAVFFILRNQYHNPYFFRQEAHHEGDRIVIELSQEVSFINKASVMLMLSELPDRTKVVVDGSRAVNIDPDVVEILEDFRETAKMKEIDYELVNIRPGVQAEYGH